MDAAVAYFKKADPDYNTSDQKAKNMPAFSVIRRLQYETERRVRFGGRRLPSLSENRIKY